MRSLRNAIHGALRTATHNGLKVHTYTAPDEGWRVNTHIIELRTQLIAIDAQYMLTHAREAAGFAKTLGKPIARLYVTHYHPDHLLGAAAFPAPIHALPEVKAKIEAVGDRVALEEHEKFPDAIPSHAEKPSLLVAPGVEVIDGVRFEFIPLEHAETEHALMIGLPDQRILITQDLIYNRVHAFVGECTFDSWSAALRRCRQLSYEKILPGHGAPGSLELYEQMEHYLSTARESYEQSSDGDELKARLIAAFPEFEGRTLLDHQKRFLFPEQEAYA